MENVLKETDSMIHKQMVNWFGSRLIVQRESSRTLAVGHLKRCPLCGALNSKRNRECFVCRWHGDFDHDPDNIEAGLTDLLDRCPELASAMTEPLIQRQSFKRSLFQWFSSLFHRRMDFKV
jgi:hypothetical protein